MRNETFRLDSQCKDGYCNYLKGMYYGIVKDCEKGKDYDGLINSALIELIGQVDSHDSIHLNELFAKTASLKYLKYKYLREVIFSSCMPLIDSIFKEE